MLATLNNSSGTKINNVINNVMIEMDKPKELDNTILLILIVTFYKEWLKVPNLYISFYSIRIILHLKIFLLSKTMHHNCSILPQQKL